MGKFTNSWAGYGQTCDFPWANLQIRGLIMGKRVISRGQMLQIHGLVVGNGVISRGQIYKFMGCLWANLEIHGLFVGKPGISLREIYKFVGCLWANVGFPVGKLTNSWASYRQTWDFPWANLQIRGLVVGKRVISRGQIYKFMGWLWAIMGFPMGKFTNSWAGCGQ